MKILVTGSTGFIGRHVVSWLIDHNFEVIATSTNEKKAKSFSWYEKVTYLPCDYYIQDIDYVNFFSKPDILIHLSWKDLPNYFEFFHIDHNLEKEIRFLKKFLTYGHTKIVVIGTCYEYGLIEGCLSENLPTNPITTYGIAKDTLRKYLSLYANINKIHWNWIRLFFLYGSGQNSKSLLPQLEAAIQRSDSEFPMSGGEQLRDYLPVEIVAENICRIALQNDYDGIVNCCSGIPQSIRSLVEDYIQAKGSNILLKLREYPYPTYEPMAFWGNNSILNMIYKRGLSSYHERKF